MFLPYPQCEAVIELYNNMLQWFLWMSSEIQEFVSSNLICQLPAKLFGEG